MEQYLKVIAKMIVLLIYFSDTLDAIEENNAITTIYVIYCIGSSSRRYV